MDRAAAKSGWSSILQIPRGEPGVMLNSAIECLDDAAPVPHCSGVRPMLWLALQGLAQSLPGSLDCGRVRVVVNRQRVIDALAQSDPLVVVTALLCRGHRRTPGASRV